MHRNRTDIKRWEERREADQRNRVEEGEEGHMIE